MEGRTPARRPTGPPRHGVRHRGKPRVHGPTRGAGRYGRPAACQARTCGPIAHHSRRRRRCKRCGRGGGAARGVLLFNEAIATLFILGAAWLVWTRPGGMTWGFFLYAIWFNSGQNYVFYV